MSLWHRLMTSLRLTFRWSNSTQTWQERTGDFVLAGGLVLAAAITFFFNLEWWQIILVWGLCLLPAVPLSFMGWLKVFGPVLYYDMVRQARRSRFIILRFIYALLLAFLLFSVAASVSSLSLSGTGSHAASRIAETYFDTFMIAQFVAVVLLTPAYVAGAITEEKDRKTLEFMLATDLLNREIVLSKLGSRLANLALVVMTGLPILSILQFLGGVDPNLVMAGFIVTAMTIAGQAGLSILCSTLCQKPRDSIGLAYLAAVAFFALSLLLIMLQGLAKRDPVLAATPLWFGDNPPDLRDAIEFLNKGNLISLLVNVKEFGFTGTLTKELPVLTGEYAIFHGVFAIACTALAIARLRRVALAQTGGKKAKRSWAMRVWPRPVVGSFPMLWKEINCERGARSSWLGWIVITLLLAFTFAPAVVIIWHACDQFYRPVYTWDNLGQSMNIWVRVATTAVGSLTILAVAVRASTSISSERDKQTFDTLMTTPLDSSTILHAKWAGSLLGGRFGIVWLVMVWALGIVTGGLHPIGLPLLVAAWTIYAAFAAVLGLYYSAVCRSSLRSTLFTIMTMIAVTVGHWLIWMCCIPLMMSGPSRHDTERHLLSAHLGIFTPPFVLGFFPFSWREIQQVGRNVDDIWMEFAAFSLVGLVAWSIATAVLYSLTSARFRMLTHRNEFAYPDRDSWTHADKRNARRLERQSSLPISPWAPPPGPVEREPEINEEWEPEEGDDTAAS